MRRACLLVTVITSVGQGVACNNRDKETTVAFNWSWMWWRLCLARQFRSEVERASLKYDTDRNSMSVKSGKRSKQPGNEKVIYSMCSSMSSFRYGSRASIVALEIQSFLFLRIVFGLT